MVIDAMALIQVLKGSWKTFGDLGDAIFKSVLKLAREWNCTRINFVADRYPVLSIKNYERSRRAANSGIQTVCIFDKNQNTPKQWKKFLSVGENKERLIEFLCQHWRTYYSHRLDNLSGLYVTSQEKCYRFTRSASDEDKVQCTKQAELASNHEEADTRLLLHAKHAATANDKVIVRSPDTDVVVLCITMQTAIEKDLFVLTGTGCRLRLVEIKATAESMDEALCRCLPGFHAFTGNITC